ncbi:hypothetical protein CSQ96_03310 [Janthinobacterium sp. BJB412]|jgi:hypothetical protein|nr:hypothetical protein CSQ96_03310 [Janthinobacterium sp. BJB412]
MLVTFSLQNENFLAALDRLAKTNVTLHNQFLSHLASVNNTDFQVFNRSHQLNLHGSHFSEPVLFGDFTIPDLDVQIYAFLEENNDLPTGLIIPFAFWKPKV